MSSCVETPGYVERQASLKDSIRNSSILRTLKTKQFKFSVSQTFKTLYELCFKHVVPRFDFVLSVDAQPSDQEMLLLFQHSVVLY